jgi:hypothetical protein
MAYSLYPNKNDVQDFSDILVEKKITPNTLGLWDLIPLTKDVSCFTSN